MGVELDRLTASIGSLDSKVTEIEAYILAHSDGNTDGTTAAQLVEFADKVDADVTRLTAAMTPVVEDTPVVEPPVEPVEVPASRFNP